MIAHWEKRAFFDITAYLADEPSVPVRLRKLGQVAANAAPDAYGGVAAEPAIRAWSRADASVAAAVHRVDTLRIDYLHEQLSSIGLGNPDFARIIYATLIGLEDLSSRDGQANESPLGTVIDLILSLE